MFVTDHIGRIVEVPECPKRIVSLCPSQTSTLMALGIGDRLVGRTRFCIHPGHELSGVEVVGGTKKLDESDLLRLKPDLVIAEKEENTPEMVEWMARHFPVYVTDVTDLKSAHRMVEDLASITGTMPAGEKLIAEIRESMVGIRPLDRSQTVLYLIWRKPWMAAGSNTYIHSILSLLGFDNLACGWQGRYPEVQLRESDLHPDHVFLSSEPFPFTEKHVAEIQQIFPSATITLVDGEIFSWYGERQRDLASYWEDLKQKIAAG